MFRYVFFFLFTVSLVFGQNSSQLRDSILKYKTTNPNLAIEFGIEYTRLTSSQKPNSEIQSTYGLIGEILLEMGLDAIALDYFNRSIAFYKAINSKELKWSNLPQPPWVIMNIGNIYFKNKDFEKASQKFNESISLFELLPDDVEEKYYGINTSKSNLGLIEQNKGNYKKAEIIYESIYQNRLLLDKKEDIIYSLSQILAINLHLGEIASAENKFQQIEKLYKEEQGHLKSSETILTRNYGYAYVVFGAYYQSLKKYKLALSYLEKADKILNSFPSEINALKSRFAECNLGLNNLSKAEQIAKDNLNIKNLSDTEKRYNYKVLENVYKQKGLDKELLKIKDSLILISSGSNSKIFNLLNNLEIQIQLVNTAREINESKILYNTYLYILIICSVILFFSLITIRINYNLQKEKGNRLEMEKEIISSQLNEKNRELVSKSNFILQRNNYLKNIKKKIETSTEETTTKLLSRELNQVISSEKTYEEFDKMFVQVFPDFYTKLNTISKLSQTDLRLASYIKMNHSNSEIAIISGISLRTVESQRYRLSKKLKLNKEQSLNSFILEI